MPDVLPGAEPASFPGGPHGALVLHGFTGNPQSMRGLAEAFAAAGFATELPLLPGHGTTVEDMNKTGWADWSKAADEAFEELASRVDKVVVAGLSMGGTLATWLLTKHPEIAGGVLVNPAVEPTDPAMIDMLRQTLDGGTDYLPAIGNDVADPDSTELAYASMPVASLLTLAEVNTELSTHFDEIRSPILVLTSRQDHVVQPSNSEFLVGRLGDRVPVEHVWLERSYHVATIDYDRDEIERRAVEFAKRVTA